MLVRNAIPNLVGVSYLFNLWRHCAAAASTATNSLFRTTHKSSGPSNIMPPKVKAKARPESEDALPTLAFTSAAHFETFLRQNHPTLPGLQLKLAKKASGIQSVTAPEAVEVALCYGWIDGRVNKLDESYWLVRYTPRRAKSIWSKKNVDTATRLIEEDRMHESGLQAVEAAKQDGRWDRAYAGSATISVPDDLVEKLEEVPSAKVFFQGLNKRERYSVLWRIETTSAQNRSKRIDALVQMLAAGNVPGAPVQPKVGLRDTQSGGKESEQAKHKDTK